MEQYEIREQHIEKVLKAKQLELQLCEAKLQQENVMVQEELSTHVKVSHSSGAYFNLVTSTPALGGVVKNN